MQNLNLHTFSDQQNALWSFYILADRKKFNLKSGCHCIFNCLFLQESIGQGRILLNGRNKCPFNFMFSLRFTAAIFFGLS